MSLVLTTELDAVNAMLEAIGMVPINSLTDDLTADVQLAQNILERTSRSVQKRGWHFNTEEDYSLSLDNDSKIPLGGNLLRITFNASQSDYRRLTRRGEWLYDATNHTYVFDATLKATVVLALDFTDLPESARDYIMVRSARIFQDKILGASQGLHQYSEADEYLAKADFMEAEGDTADHSIFDNYDVASVLDRQNDFVTMEY